MPQGIKTTVVLDRTTTIKASLHDVESSLIISVVLVILVVFLFLRNGRATLIPSVAVPVSLIGTFAVMYLLDYSLDNLSLMALTISTGFVVDDAIVVMENISRYLEMGMPPAEAALKGAKEIGFTVLTMSTSLIAVFIPLLMMGGIVGRLFREFAVTLSTAILVSMVISLTTTPMMCAHLLKAHGDEKHGRLYRASERFFDGMLNIYRHSLLWVLDNSGLMLVVLLLTIALNVVLIVKIPKGFFPQQDTGAMVGGVQGPQDASFGVMNSSIKALVNVIKADPAVANVNAYTGGRRRRQQWRLYLRRAQTARRAQSERHGNHQPLAAQDEPASRGLGLPAGRSGSAHRRSRQQCSLPVHPAGGQCAGSGQMGTHPADADEEASRFAGCE